MNRIILIGNGFDIAHGFGTSYEDFMKHLSIGLLLGSNKYIENNTLYKGIKGIFDLKVLDNNSLYHCELITEKNKSGYWSDLEKVYFDLIYIHRDDSNKIIKINEEFDYVKGLLEKYLLEVEERVEIGGELHSIFNDIIDKEKKDFVTKNMIHPFNEPSSKFEKTHIITFNYTSKKIEEYYEKLVLSYGKNKYPHPPIHIHGKLKIKPEDEKNPIIFGYGDEDSDKYKELELQGDNNLLKNFKTFQYLKTNKYMEVLGLLESSKEIYVQLIGHSSGLCDKALLKEIFQHKNVKHIESVYHSNEGEYFKNLYNISRIFDDNTIMRKKMVCLEDTFIIGETKKEAELV
ncbi:MAG: hypothetical protein HRT66_06130 [Flavobacteriaceae bacterium]|nr:hypothetical protein [Flavobacteriaceae bacterium]